MSILRRKFPLGLILAGVLAGLTVGVQADDPDPILEYYWTRAAETAFRTLPVYLGSSYRFDARTYYHHVTSDGDITRTDSAVIRYFYTGAVQDSQQVIAGDGDRFKRFEPVVPDVFGEPFHLHFYPNDTGGSEIAIGFRADSATAGEPDGLIVINRRRHHLIRLYASYTDKPDYRRYSRFFRFAETDGLIVPDSISEVATREGVFGLESYRVEAVISDVQVEP